MAFAILARDQVGLPIQALYPDPAQAVTGAVGAASVRVALPTGADVVRVATLGDCFIKFGTVTVVATAADSIFPKGSEVFRVPAGVTHLAFIQSGAGTTITVTGMV
jgi:hypothetical protein